MKNTNFKVEDVFGDVISKDISSQEQITKLKNLFSQNNVSVNINNKINLFKPRKEKIKNYEPSAPPYYEQNFVSINEFKTIILLRRSSFQPDRY